MNNSNFNSCINIKKDRWKYVFVMTNRLSALISLYSDENILEDYVLILKGTATARLL